MAAGAPSYPRIQKLTKREADAHRVALREFPHTWNPLLRASKPRHAILEYCCHCRQARVRFKLRPIDFEVQRHLRDQSPQGKALEAEFYEFLASPAPMEKSRIVKLT